MRVTLDALIVLDAIDRTGSFAAAADELYRVPSAITYTVKKLEQDLDVALFDRSGYRARMTEAGEKLLAEGRYLLKVAWDLERATKQVATGWESELNIVVDDMVPMERLFPLIEEFYQQEHGTQLHINKEVRSGSWEALMSGRADLIIGATGSGPAGGGYTSFSVGVVELVFAVAPDHPLASMEEPLSEKDIRQHRGVATADSARNAPAFSSAVLSGQSILTVPDMHAKREAQLRGLGVGYLPRRMIEEDLAAGRLVAKVVDGAAHDPQSFIAWRAQQKGKALQWFLKRLRTPELFEGILLPAETKKKAS